MDVCISNQSAVEHGMHKNFMKHMHSTDYTLHVNIQYFI